MTTTDIATHDEGSLDRLPPVRPGAPAALQMLASHVEVMAQAKHLATAMVLTDMVPTRFKGEEHTGDAAAAILYGLELGLTPIQSLQRVIPIHGMPSIEARTMAGLLMSRGYTIRVASQADDQVTVHGWMPGRSVRDDEPDALSVWTIERARQAGYIPTPKPGVDNPRPSEKMDWLCNEKSGRNGKYYTLIGNMKYITDPRTMLKAKATAEVCRDLAPDVLLGISYSREDLESERWDDEPRRQSVQSERPSESPRTVSVDEILGDVEPEPAAPKPKRKPAAKKAEPKQEPQDAEVVEDQPPAGETPEPASDLEPKPEPAQDSDTTTPAEPARLGELLAQGNIAPDIDGYYEDRAVVFAAILDRQVEPGDVISDGEAELVIAKLETMAKHNKVGDWINDALNRAALIELERKEAAEAAAAATTTEGN